MKIDLDKVSKKFGSQWIFRNITASFEPGIHAITGANGSGKSTLLKIISGIMTPNEGLVSYTTKGQNIPVEEIYRSVSYTAPYLDVPDELTLRELIAFHANMRPLYKIKEEELIAQIEIPATKQIKDCSSGMKQRVKFALAFHTESKILLVDEPTANMDHNWRDQTLDMVRSQTQERITIICSNEPVEYAFASKILTL